VPARPLRPRRFLAVRILYEISESFRIAFAQIVANKLRSALTALGVVIGIVAVTLMGTAINGIDVGVDRSFAGFGDDILYVTKWPWRDMEDWWNFRNRRPIRFDYAPRSTTGSLIIRKARSSSRCRRPTGSVP
jgi:putative ABC transport system permease protein